MKNNGALTPKGTPPQPTRRATKHKTSLYGAELQAKAVIRRIRRPARPARNNRWSGSL